MGEFYHKEQTPEHKINQLKDKLLPLFSMHPEKTKIEVWLNNQRGDRGLLGLQGLNLRLQNETADSISKISSKGIFEMLRSSRW